MLDFYCWKYYILIHPSFILQVAVKVIDKKKAKEDAYVRKNMRREGKLLQNVRQKNVVRLYEIMETENSYYLVTELCRGGDLMDHICNKRRLEEREARRYIRQIITAVDYLHKAGILHRYVMITSFDVISSLLNISSYIHLLLWLTDMIKTAINSNHDQA